MYLPTVQCTLHNHSYPNRRKEIMKKASVLAAVLVITAVSAGTVSALPGLSMDIAFALPVPSGDFGDTAKTGLGASADAFVGIPMIPLKLGGHIGYNQFSMKEKEDENFSTIEVVPSVRYQFGLPIVGYAFLQAGAGYFQLSSSVSGVEAQNKFGFNVSVGAAASFLTSMKFFAMPAYTWINTEDTSTSYITFNIGLAF